MQSILNTNTLINIIFTITILWLIKESFTIHMGPICAYSNTPYIIALIFIIIIATILEGLGTINLDKYGITIGTIKLDKYGIIIGIVLFTVICIIKYIIDVIYTSKTEKAYKEEHKLVVDNINMDNLKELIKECEQNNIKLTDRKCSCKCKFGDKKPSKNNEDCYTLDNEYTESPEECSAIFGCGDVKCSVFNTLVDYSTGCVWSEQDTYESYGDKKCLLSKIETNEQLKELVNSIKNNKE